jgi:excisionase family DNA binding protein
MNGVAMIRPLLSVDDVVQLLGMKKSWVYARADSGELPSIRLPGGRRKFDAADIAAWLEKQKRRPATVHALDSHRSKDE